MEILAQPVVLLALLGILVLAVALMRVRHESFDTHTMVTSALLLALAVVLHQLHIVHLPQGGSVTAGAMLPLILIAYRFGVGTGVLAGFVYGMINIIQDPFILHPVQVLFDYPLPFMAMGLAGLCRNHLAIRGIRVGRRLDIRVPGVYRHCQVIGPERRRPPNPNASREEDGDVGLWIKALVKGISCAVADV